MKWKQRSDWGPYSRNFFCRGECENQCQQEAHILTASLCPFVSASHDRKSQAGALTPFPSITSTTFNGTPPRTCESFPKPKSTSVVSSERPHSKEITWHRRSCVLGLCCHWHVLNKVLTVCLYTPSHHPRGHNAIERADISCLCIIMDWANLSEPRGTWRPYRKICYALSEQEGNFLAIEKGIQGFRQIWFSRIMDWFQTFPFLY